MPVGDLFLVQLAGAPGSGKSTFAAALAGARDAVIVNSDVVKSTLLDAGVVWSQAGPAAYQVLFALADDLLGQGRSVVLDSPSHYDYIPANGQRVASQHAVRYRFIELVCDDIDELKRRLAERKPRRSQMPDLDTPPPDSDKPTGAVRVGTHRWQTAGPAGGHLVLDARGPVESFLPEALAYVDA